MLAEKWDRHTHIVIGRPDESIPLYRVQRESGDSSVKTLYRNMLLPFSAIPSISDLDMPSPSVPMISARSRQVKETRVVVTNHKVNLSQVSLTLVKMFM